MSRLSLIFKKAAFPAVMAIISFILFLFAYRFFISIKTGPYYYYFGRFMFLIPFIVFSITTYLAYKEQIKAASSIIATAVTIGISLSLMFYWAIYWAMFFIQI